MPLRGPLVKDIPMLRIGPIQSGEGIFHEQDLIADPGASICLDRTTGAKRNGRSPLTRVEDIGQEDTWAGCPGSTGRLQQGLDIMIGVEAVGIGVKRRATFNSIDSGRFPGGGQMKKVRRPWMPKSGL